MIHILRTYPGLLHAMKDGLKRFEYRKNDRDFKVGDILILIGYDPGTELLTGACLYMRVQYYFDVHDAPDLEIPEGFCIMDVVPATPDEVFDYRD